MNNPDPLANAITAAELMNMHFPDLCPACNEPAIYNAPEDRYFHTDGTDNRDCWVVAIRRGDVAE